MKNIKSAGLSPARRDELTALFAIADVVAKGIADSDRGTLRLGRELNGPRSGVSRLRELAAKARAKRG